MKTVANLTSLLEADMICAQLRAFGIETFLPDQGMVLMQPLYSEAIGGIRVQVADEDYERACAILSASPEEPAA
jgi:hypothetical protein